MRVLSQPGPEEKQDAGEETVPVLESRLLPAQPNPFNPRTLIRFAVKKTGPVKLKVYNIRGELICGLTDRVYTPGWHVVEWRGEDRNGRSVPSGLYLIRFEGDRTVLTQRVVLVR